MTMEATAMLVRLVPEFPDFSLFFFFNFFAALIVAGICLQRFLTNNFVAARFSFCFTAIVCFLYQIPLALFSTQVELALQYPWVYSCVVNGTAFVLAFFGILSRRSDFKRETVSFPVNAKLIYVITFFVALFLLLVYLVRVPWRCTGLFALFFDPWMTLLAREFGVKLIGSSFATYSIGAYANIVAPFFVLLSVWLIINSFRQQNWLGILAGILYAMLGLLAIFGILTTGVKGLLMPLIIMLVTANYFFARTWFTRLLLFSFSLIFIMSSLVVFELLKERNSIIGSDYDFAACSVEAGTSEKSLELLESLKHREYSLGLPNIYIEPIQSRLMCLSDHNSDKKSCPPSALGPSPQQSTKREDNINRGEIFYNSLIYRIFIVPFQVSVWHFMYAESEQVDGLKTLPISRRIFGESLNMPELVYQKYYVIYSQGDKTITGTAPSSFFIAYPAYLGWIGFVIALGGIIVFDIFLAKFFSVLNASLVPFLVGAIAIMSINFMTSDFIVVLLSHGGMAGIFLIWVYSFCTGKK